jgi:uncharacterized repeat protein (TIGR03803 family)
MFTRLIALAAALLLQGVFSTVSAASPANGHHRAEYLANLSHRTGQHPASEPVLGPDGRYYGVLPEGARDDVGAIYQLAADGTLAILHRFKGRDGATPMGRLVLASDGALYGTTYGGSKKGCGTIFRLEPPADFHVLHAFNCNLGGGNPTAGLIQGQDSRLYGTTTAWGRHGIGVIFAIDLDGSYSVIRHFNPDSVGGIPVGELFQAADGRMFGITSMGGPRNGGTLYSVALDGNLTREKWFTSDLHPTGGLELAGARDKLYFTFEYGGVASIELRNGRIDGVGTVEFGAPVGGLTLGPDGNTLYGFCRQPDGSGCIYTITPKGKVSFVIGNLKGAPAGRPVFDASGGILGLTHSGGLTDSGTVFQVSPKGL